MLQKLLLFFIVFFPFSAVNAQLCPGSLGDPVVDIDFGSGSNPGPAIPSSTQGYSYNPSDCPGDGFYTIRNNTSSCFDDSWYSLTSDHTGNANGYFMLVNASLDTSDFYVDTIRGLCPNTTFEFAAWVLNILKSSACQGGQQNPDIKFKIENISGEVIESFTTGTIFTSSSPQWKQYGFYFKTPSNTSDVVIRMTNIAPGGCGNDLALDDITFRPCGPMLSASINGNTQSDTINVCEGLNHTYTFHCNVSAGYPNPSFQWQENNSSGWVDIQGENSNTLTQNLLLAGNYKFRLAVAASGNLNISTCRIFSNVLSVNINSKPKISINEAGTQCIGNNIILTASGAVTYVWSGPNGFSGDTTSVTIFNLSNEQAGNYYVTGTSIYGCINTDSVNISAHALPGAVSIKDTSICLGKGIYLNGSGNGTYVWSPPDGLSSTIISNPFATPSTSTQYTLTVTNEFSCASITSVKIEVLQPPVLNSDGNKTILQGQSVQINAKAEGTDISYYWSPVIYINDPSSLTPFVSPPRDTTYTLYAISNVGCGSVSLPVFIKVYPKLNIPNAFSPNGDGINDTWKITPIETYPGAEIFVFNRYGQTIFHTNNYTPWNGTFNGKPLPPGTYYYVIDTKTSLVAKLSGWLLLIK